MFRKTTLWITSPLDPSILSRSNGSRTRIKDKLRSIALLILLRLKRCQIIKGDLMVEIGVLIVELLSIFAIVEDILGIHIFSVIQHESTISEINDSLYVSVPLWQCIWICKIKNTDSECFSISSHRIEGVNGAIISTH